jgi:hypothetical protein
MFMTPLIDDDFASGSHKDFVKKSSSSQAFGVTFDVVESEGTKITTFVPATPGGQPTSGPQLSPETNVVYSPIPADFGKLQQIVGAIPRAEDGHVITADYHNGVRDALTAILNYFAKAQIVVTSLVADED